MVKIYCEVCNDHIEVIAEATQDTDFPEQGIWGDVVCTKCHFVIASFQAPKEGIYELQRVGDLVIFSPVQNPVGILSYSFNTPEKT